MIKIKLFEPEIHRNETTFRPLWFIKDLLADVGIELITDEMTDSYDFMLVGQASIADKKKPLQESVEMGLEKLFKITGDYIIIDGQDAPTLIGTGDVFRHAYNDNNCKLFLKTSYYKDFDNYKNGWVLGRKYWGSGDYSVPDIDKMKPKMKLAGFNWLSTIQPTWNTGFAHKVHDIWAYFQYPMNKKVYEHGILQSVHYDNFRKGLHDELDKLEKKYSILRMVNNKRVSQHEYYQMMLYSKIIIAAFGYGEMAPRDIESVIFNAILLKNDMSHIWTMPNPYIDDETYISIKWDWSNVQEKIEYALENYEQKQKYFVQNMKQKYIEENDPVKRVVHWYNLLKNIDGVESE